MTRVQPPAANSRDHRSRSLPVPTSGQQFASAASGGVGGEELAGGEVIEPQRAAISEECEIRSRARRIRWHRRSVNARLGDWLAGQADGDWSQVAARRICACGRVPTGDDVTIKVRPTDDGAVAFASGLQTCGSIWGCPVCSATIRTRRAMEVQAAATAHTSAGGRLAMLTLTIRHDQADSLAGQFDTLTQAWGRVQRRDRWRQLRCYGLDGTITATEVTHGFAPGSMTRNGWHAHRHLLLFVPGGWVGDWAMALLRMWVPGAWADAVQAECGKRPTMLRGAHLMELDAGAAKYVAKVADELTRADTKTAHRQPFGLLDHVEDGEAWAVARWLEYVEATKGRRALVWSDGLRDLLLSDVEDLTDEEIAAQEVEGVVVQVLPAADWVRLMRPGPDGTPRAFDLLELHASRWRPPDRSPPPPVPRTQAEIDQEHRLTVQLSRSS